MNTNLKTQNKNIADAMTAKAKQPKAAKAIKATKTTTANKPAPKAKAIKATKPVAETVQPVESKPVDVKLVATKVEVKPGAPVIEPIANVSADNLPKGQHITLPAGALKAALDAVERACAKNSTLPALTHILIETVDTTHIKLTATNLDFTLWHYADAKVEHPGAVCVPAVLADLLAKVNDGANVTLITNPKTFKLRAKIGRATVNLIGLAPSEFPAFNPNPVNGDSTHVTLQIVPETVIEIYKRIVPFAATDDARPVLTGIGVTATIPPHTGEDATVTFAAADGFRLAHLKREATFHFAKLPAQSFSVIPPAKLFGEILKISKDESKPLPFQFHMRYDKKGVLEHGIVQVETETFGLRMNLLDGNFPNYQQIDNEPVKLPIIPLMSAETNAVLERANLFTESSTVRLMPKPQAGHILIQSSSAEHGDYEEDVLATFDAERLTPDNYVIAFNALYLKQALTATAYKETVKPVHLRVGVPSAPAFLSAPGYRHVVMPMHSGQDKPATPSKPESAPTNTPVENKPANAAAPAPTPTAVPITKPVTPKPAPKPNGHTPTNKAKPVTAAKKPN